MFNEYNYQSAQMFKEFLHLQNSEYRIEDICREKKHIDLSFTLHDTKNTRKYIIIIENKVKSIPNQKQLQDYYEKVKKDNPKETINLFF